MKFELESGQSYAKKSIGKTGNLISAHAPDAAHALPE